MDFFLAADGVGDGRNLFTVFALSSKPYTPANLEKVNAELARDPTSAGQLLQSRTCRAIFLSDFSERVERILTWLNPLADLESARAPQKRLKFQLPDIIYGFARSLVVPLLGSEYSEYHSSRGFADLVVTTTHLSHIFRKRGVSPKTHKLLLEKISQNGQQLMRSILPSIDGAKLIQTLLAEAQAGAEIQAVGSATILAEWITAAVELCRGCSGNHELHAELAKWNSLVELRDSLTKILITDNKRPSVTALALTQMRVLSAEDKKSGNTNCLAPPDYLSVQDFKNLELFNLQVPTGLSTLESVITRLRERESFSLFHVFVKSFPCALCLRRTCATDTVPVLPRTMPRKQFTVDSLPNSFTSTLLGWRLGPWKICLSEHAFKDLLLANKEGYLSAIARKMKELASGQWDKSLRRPLSPKMIEECGGVVPVPLWRATYGSFGRILWQVNVGYDEECETESQIITVWRIGTADEVRKDISQVVQIQKTYTVSHVQRCRYQCGFPFIPENYPVPDGAISNTSQKGDGQGAASIEVIGSLMSNKFYSITGKVLDRIFSSPDEIEFPFDISKEEIEIVKKADSAAFILGRSGTGKTTCLLFKLLCRNIASRNEETPIRQIFLTRSGFLAERLRDYLRRLMESQFGNPSMRTKMESRAPPEYILRESRDPLEDETLDTLGDDKFPLVCTFDQLFGFLERVIKLTDRSNFDFPTADGSMSTPWDRTVRRLIDYNVFNSQYWKRRFNDRKDGLEPDLVLAEILGIIKGSTSAERGFRPLSRDEYVEFSYRKAPVFTDKNSRNAVYDMYQDYERQKWSLGDRDDIDRAIHLLNAFEKDRNLKSQVQALLDEVYVDEVQDNKLLEMDLLFTLVRNPYGIHFAGDTAQCISRDNTFRFEDIKARFYEHFISLAKDLGKPACAKAELIKLPKNYRSHQGILSLAADIVDMLCNGFPGQIDVLPREVGSYPGVKPTMFVGFDYKILARDTMPGTEQALSDFGAEQVIIVKNDMIKAELKKHLVSTLILTIYQSKGLEFEDVILYNFFSDSMWDNIRLPTLELLLAKDSAVRLDKTRYAGLCSELKHLYVAVTRARKNLWMVEHNKASVQNIVMLWTGDEQVRGPLVSCVDVDDSRAEETARTIIKPGKSTSPEAWRNQGEMLLQRGLYEDAGLCFRKANYKQGEDLAEAYQLYETASRLDVGASSQQAKKIFGEAAKLFEDSLFIQKAAETWGAAEQYGKAGEILRAHKEYGKAALWYRRDKDFLQAAQCHHMAEQHDEAVKDYRKGEHWAQLVEYLEQYQEYISDSIKTRYSTLINLLLHRGDLPEALLPTALETLGDENAKEDFYKKFEKTEDLLTFYSEHKRYHDYFKLALREGKFEEAVLMGSESRVAKDIGSKVPPEDLLILYNGVMAGYTWSSIQFDLNNLFEAKVPLNITRLPAHAIPELGQSSVPELRGPGSGWQELLDCLKRAGDNLRLPRQRLNVYSGKFFRVFGDEFLDLVEFLRLDTTLRHKLSQAAEMAQLPALTIQKFASLSGDLLSERKPSTNLITSLGGLVFSHLQDQVMILKWSPLFSIVSKKDSTQAHQNSGSYEHFVLTLKQTIAALTEWLVPIAARIVPCTLLRMHTLLIVHAQDPCFLALQGLCRKQPDLCNHGVHTKLPSDEIQTNIWALLDAAGLYCASGRLYHHRKFQESDSIMYHKKGRAFLEKLLKELTYISPLLNDSELQLEIWRIILGENSKSQWALVRDGLASLFFHRLRPKEWVERGTVSALLEERSLANRLGVMPWFLQFLGYRSRIDREGLERYDFIKECNSLQPAEVAKYDGFTLVHRIGKVTKTIMAQSAQALQSFHSVLSLYEYLTLELINRTLRIELLVPRSQQQFIRDLTQMPHPSDEERNSLEHCLIQLLSDLCDLLLNFGTEYWRLRLNRDYSKQHNLESDSNPEALFFACGRPLWNGNRYMVRRSLDHLALCMINLGVGRSQVLPMGYNKLGNKIKEVFEKWGSIPGPSQSTPVHWSRNFKPELVARELADAYWTYNKEELLIIRTAKRGSRFQFLPGSKLRQVVVGEQQHTSAQTTLEKTQMLELGEEATAASKISQWWRRCSMRLQARRANALERAKSLSQGRKAQAKVMVNDIIASRMTSRYRKHRNILSDHGVSLLGGILDLKGLVRRTHDMAMELVGGKYKLSSTGVEDLQDIIGLLEKRKDLLEGTEAMFADETEVQLLFETTVGKLEEKMDRALWLLGTYQGEVKRWARNMEEWRGNKSR
ncbi:hypothetical protein BGX38DRAFT_1277007 [Terfezia claveryi]|nr:hypothetical protein BGX38DRAFT_1277007 [Terfezia claveryi]